MYKTIRHGENSLQYTILPQNDDFRIEGKITGSGNTCGHKQKRGRRRSFFAYLGLLFVCTVIIGAILVPFLVSAECLPNPSDWFLRTRAALLEGSNVSSSSSLSSSSSSLHLDKDDNKTESTIKAYLLNNINKQQILKSAMTTTVTTTTEEPLITTVKSVDDISATLDSIFTIPILNNDDGKDLVAAESSVTTTTTKLLTPRMEVHNNIRSEQILTTELPIAIRKGTDIPTIVVVTSNIMKNQNDDNNNDVQKQNKDEIAAVGGLPTAIFPTPTIFSLSLFTTTKKPIILPVLAKTNSIVRENGKDIEKIEKSNNWIKLRWPPVYFQWEGYKTAIILPAILGLTLIGVVLLATICLVSRNKRTIVATMKKRNPNDIEGSGEDNATLLTTGNLSDDD